MTLISLFHKSSGHQAEIMYDQDILEAVCYYFYSENTDEAVIWKLINLLDKILNEYEDLS